MLIRIDDAAFTDPKLLGPLDAFLSLVETGMHELFLEDGQEDIIMESVWLKSLGDRHQQMVIELIQKTLDANQYITIQERRERGVVELNSNNFGDKLQALNEPLSIVVEDGESDKYFIISMMNIYKGKSKKLLRSVENGWLRFVHAGGKPHITKVIQQSLPFSQKYNPLRNVVLIDSDKTSPDDQYSKEIEKVITFCQENEIMYHILFKREIENYIPISILEKNTPIELKTVMEKYKELLPEQRDFFDLEKGFNNRRPDSTLFATISEDTFNALRQGFSRDRIIDVKKRFYTLFSDPDCNYLAIEEICKHQENPSEIKQMLAAIANLL